MSAKDKCKMYRETQSSIIKALEMGLKLDRDIYMNQIVLIKKDIISNDESERKAAIEMINFLICLNVEEISVEFVKILHDNSVNKMLQKCVMKSIKQKVVDTIIDNRYSFKSILSPWKNQNTNQLTNIIEDVVSDLPKNLSKSFFINTVVPTLMAIDTDNQIRDALTDIAFMMSTIVPISDLRADELKSFLKDVNMVYVVNIGELRDKEYPNWHNLWIFLVRFCDKHIHLSMELTNKLLRVVEFAFRNSSIQQRLKGYDCWKELIDNASLDMNHMCSAKQIKLLITPLKAKFSKQEVVICKRFDVFTYLLEKLQHKAVLCLTEFFEFCFGPVGDNKDASKTGQGKGVPQIWTKSTKVLIEIIGHSHGKTVACLSTEDIIKLEKPVINYTNIMNYYKIVINSVAECCALLKEVDIESKRDAVLKCMWKSVFNLIIPIPGANREKYFKPVADVLDNYLTQSRGNPYFEDLLILIFNILMSYDEEFVYESIEYIYKQLLTTLFTIGDLPVITSDKFKVVLTHWFSKMFMVENKVRIVKETTTIFTKLKPLNDNVVHVGKVWLCLANEWVDLSLMDIENFADFNSFFMWPADHLHYLEEVTKKQIVLHWMKLYRKITVDSESKKLNIMKSLQKTFKSNPLLNPDVVSLLNVMSQFETKFSVEFVNNMMMVSSQILQLPNLKNEEEQKITALIMQYFEPSLECFTCDHNDELIKNMCVCIQHILCIHKGYKLLDSFATFMKVSPSNLKAKFSYHLSTILLDLFNKESETNSYNAKELQKALQVLNVETVGTDDVLTVFIPPSGRSARIAHMAKNSPRSPGRRGKKAEASPIALRLFGKDLETLSPLHVKGSQLNNVTPKSRKIVNTKTTPRSIPSINDEKSADFVPIDTEVKFQPEKLSRHQKEMLKKRREDIPALYQDLSQSLSQDMFSSPSSSKGFEKTDQKDSDDKRKVIVEVIGDQLESDVFKEENNDVPFHTSSSTAPKLQAESVDDIQVPNLYSAAALSTEMIPDAPVQNMEDLSVPNADLNFEANLFPDAILSCEVISEAIEEFTAATGDDIKIQEDLYPQTIDPEETMIEEERKTINEICEVESNPIDTAVENKEVEVQKPTESEDKETGQVQVIAEEKESEKIEAEEKEKRRKQKFEAEDQVQIIPEEKESEKFEAEEKEKRRKQKIEAELQKLRMDIVGAEKFLATSRRTRTREKSKKLHEAPTGKNKPGSKDEKLSPHKQQSRKSLGIKSLDVKDSATEKNRRKTIGGIHETKSSTDSSENESNKPKEPGTPRSRGRRSLSLKIKPEPNVTTNINDSHKTPKSSKGLSKKYERVENKIAERGEKRKRSSGDEESEDIIESSQECNADVTPVFNSSKRRSLIDISSTQEKLNTPEIDTEMFEKGNTNNEIEGKEINLSVEDTTASDPAETAVGKEVVQDEAKINQPENQTNEGEPHPEANTSQDTTVTQESTQDITENHDHTEEFDTETQVTTTTDTQTQDTLTQIGISGVSEDIQPPVLYFDLPKKPELTESERMMCQMDTMSICLPSVEYKSDELADEMPKEQELSMVTEDVLSTPDSKTSIPSSPITVETPNRTSELLNNTLDISPINSKSSSDDGEPEENQIPVTINFKAEMEELDKMEKEKMQELLEEKEMQKEQHQEPEGSNNNVLLGDIPTDLETVPNHAESVFQQDENLKIEEGITCPPEYIVSMENLDVQPRDDGGPVQEPNPLPEETTGYRKSLDMPDIEGAKPVKDTSIQERASRFLNLVNVSSPITHKIFVKRRNVTMSPSTARIKKLMSNFSQKPNVEESVVEVKEEDLLTFTREVPSPLAVPRSSILKRKISDSSESDGISPCAKRKRVNFSDPCLTSKKLFIRDEYKSDVGPNHSLEDSPEPISEEELPTVGFSSSDESSGSERFTETETVETEPSLAMVNPLALRKDRPIYPKLVDCKEDVILILKRVTSPMFITTLMNKLKSKEIKTIGDLARQSEAEINRFPFKVPVVANVYKALDNYYKKNIDKFVKDGPERKEVANVNGNEDSKRQGVIKKTSPRKSNIRMELKQLMEKSKAEGTFEEFIKPMLAAVEKNEMLDIVKSHYKLEFTDFLPETDFTSAVKHIAQKIGFANVLELLTSSIENSEEESVYYDCLMKQSIEKRPLSNIWENRSLDDIRSGLEDSISRNVFSRHDVVNQCFLPLIESPKDIYSYLSQLSVVHLSDVVVERFRGTDPTEFFRRILESCDGQFDVVLRREIMTRVKSPSEVVGVFQDCIESQDEEKRNEILVEMFKFVSGKLSMNTLLELHIDFLRRIPGVGESSGK